MKELEGLRDIRGLEEIPDISFYLFLLVIAFGVLFLGGIATMIYRHFSGRKKDITRKEVLKRLENIDFDDSKDASYKITKYARYLATEERSKKIFLQLESKLSKYKYIQNPPPFDEETIGEYNLFLEVVDG